MARTPFFVFELDSGDIQVYASADAARWSIEPGLVDIAEVADASGQLFEPTAQGNDTILVQRDEPNRSALEQRLRAYVEGRRIAVPPGPDFILSVADALAALQWSCRWPKRPRWLDRRIHGDGPPTFSSVG